MGNGFEPQAIVRKIMKGVYVFFLFFWVSGVLADTKSFPSIGRDLEKYYLVSEKGILKIFFNRDDKDWGYRAVPVSPLVELDEDNIFRSIRPGIDPGIAIEYLDYTPGYPLYLTVNPVARSCRRMPGFEMKLSYDDVTPFIEESKVWKLTAEYSEKACVAIRRSGCGGYVCTQYAAKHDPLPNQVWYITDDLGKAVGLLQTF